MVKNELDIKDRVRETLIQCTYETVNKMCTHCRQHFFPF